MKTLKLEHLENALESIKKNSPELKEFVLLDTEAGGGRKIQLAEKQEYGLIVKTDFMTYTEMNQFLRGYSFRAENRFFKTYSHDELLEATNKMNMYGGGFVKSLTEPIHRADANNKKKLTATFQEEIEKYLNF